MPVWALGSFLQVRKCSSKTFGKWFQCPCGLWGLFYLKALLSVKQVAEMVSAPVWALGSFLLLPFHDFPRFFPFYRHSRPINGPQNGFHAPFHPLSDRYVYLRASVHPPKPARCSQKLSPNRSKWPFLALFWPLSRAILRASLEVPLPPSMLATRKRIDRCSTCRN